ncbi:MAG: hypothetical protein KIS62_13665 [Ramlibacter sp.]|nr:hypothetical protein [Ramlibacter sp.]MCW5650788.1 hypothetical protein [Ramlibacter sp.]
MGIALSAVHVFFTPLQDLAAWLLSPVATPAPTRSVPACTPVPLAHRARPARTASPQPRCIQAQRPLRVVRVMDRSGGRAATAGNRLVISGRMADVCAELDRLAALEARAQKH